METCAMSDPDASGPITGGCLCGAVRYEITAEPMLQGKCYCDSCRKSSTTGHVAVMGVPEDGFKVTGELTGYTSPGGSGAPLTRKFCPKCGSQICATVSSFPGVVMVRASGFDDPERFTPQMAVFAASAPSWDRPQPDVPAFDTVPPRPPE
jgi:hypothetical protein